MDIKLESYKVFYTVAECGSFSDAAKKLFITQSAVSQQIKSLENELGALLFVRGRKGAKLT
ncbi:MAG: LysR family transcriptional regulator, partial [Clostridia bacterium]|nr:LysR family transcriptional regulator [Clostridia bacterium]